MAMLAKRPSDRPNAAAVTQVLEPLAFNRNKTWVN
jgi:hypothetical protein